MIGFSREVNFYRRSLSSHFVQLLDSNGEIAFQIMSLMLRDGRNSVGTDFSRFVIEIQVSFFIFYPSTNQTSRRNTTMTRILLAPEMLRA